jgi:hypothetical protein
MELFSEHRLFPPKIFGATIVIGLWGAWCILKSTMMFVAPSPSPVTLRRNGTIDYCRLPEDPGSIAHVRDKLQCPLVLNLFFD